MIGMIMISRLIDFIHYISGYFFGISTNALDYFSFATIPVFGMLLNSKRSEFKAIELIIDISIILFSVIIVIAIGLYLLTIIRKPISPFIPEYLITEPINMYSTLMIVFGIAIPFLLVNRAKKTS